LHVVLVFAYEELIQVASKSKTRQSPRRVFFAAGKKKKFTRKGESATNL
jgi:hypothetical protein